MKIVLHRNFEKKYAKLRKQIKAHTKERLALFLRDEFHPLLNNHPLRGKYMGYRSINITGDFRALYRRRGSDDRIFTFIDTHSNLYG